jgi:ureidoacrylate peracid hydrolase
MSLAVHLAGRYYRMYPKDAFLGYAEKDLTLSPADTAFLLCDVYGLGYDEGDQDVHSDWEGLVSGQSTSREGEIVRKAIRPALDAARAVGFPIVYVSNSAPRIALQQSAYGEQKWDTLHVVKDELYAERNVDPLEYNVGPSNVLDYSAVIAPREGDYYIRKHVHSAFFDTRLDTLLRNLGVRNLVCVGFALDVCLGNTMIDALWRNYHVLLLRDCTYAIEIPGTDEPGAWTARWILYTECAIGCTATSAAWQNACNAALEHVSAASREPSKEADLEES